jgi:MoaA/NifB/PqqE/SkfB family radical SAM enzyme
MLKDTFCSSPWFHLRINHAGYYLPCRWSDSIAEKSNYHISHISMMEYMNSNVMNSIRMDLLAGKSIDMCKSCYYEDQHNKVSGRQRQLLKSAVNLSNFNKTMLASPHWDTFFYTHNHQGNTDHTPVDLQIDIGNTCNSACIMCNPFSSSRLVKDYDKLIKIEPQLFKQYEKFKNWAEDDNLVEKFVNDLAEIPNVQYIHFLGGETLYLKSFYTICNRLIERGLSKNIAIGTTTNATVYTPELEHIIKNFKHVHLGISIETVTPLNDYIRWPSEIDQVLANIDKFIELKKQADLQLSLRITPNIFSIYHIDLMFEYMIKNKIIAESCNILSSPSCLRMELLPNSLRKQVQTKIQRIIDEYDIKETNQIINRRREDLVNPVIASVINEYKNFIDSYQEPNDLEQERYNLVKFVRAFETLRNNSILSYLPEYEEFLRTYGY